MKIIPMQPDQIPALSNMAAEAFLSAPVYRHLLPDADRRREFLRHFFHFRLVFGQRKGLAFTTPEQDAVSVWLPPEVRLRAPDYLSADLLRGIRAAGVGTIRQMLSINAIGEGMERRHCPEPHWQLAPIAVSPERQGEGIGAQLLRHGLELVDLRQGSVFLDTQAQRTADYYRRFGFRAVESRLVEGADIPIIGMVRRPGE